MTDIIASEWIKLRSLRSPHVLSAAVLVSVIVGCGIALAMTAEWDTLSADRQAHFASADPAMLVMPFAQFCLATLGGLAISAEYSSGFIRASLTAAPWRGRVFAAKAAVVAGFSLVVGVVTAFGTLAAGWVIVGDRPAPINPWGSTAEGIASAASSSALIVVVALVAFGLGAVIRSAAGTLVTMAALLFVLPSLVLLLPAPLNELVSSVMLPNLSGELAAGEVTGPIGMIAWVVLALGAGAFALNKRDA